MSKPNIIHFHAESWDGRLLGLLGHPALRHATPHIDQLAEGGTTFENTYCSHPICCSSRANMWSGRYTQHAESWNNFKGLESHMWTLLDELPRTHTVKTIGKLDYLSGGHSIPARLWAWLGSAGIDKPPYIPPASERYEIEENERLRCHEKDWRLADEAIAFLETQAEQPNGKPFFMTLSTGLVHATFRTNRYWLEKIPEEAVDIPPMDPGTHPCHQYQRLAKSWHHGFDDTTVRTLRRIYFAMCAEADAIVGAVHDAMQRLGLADNTYFVFTSDHGELAFEHQLLGKMSFFEGSVRVPLILTGPGVAAGQRRHDLASLIDLCPTFMEMAGLPPREGLDGESLLPPARGQTSQRRDWAYACFTGATLNTSGYMLRKGRWKYIVYVGYPAQLFDIAADPEELEDQLDNEPTVVAELDAILRSVVDVDETHRRLMAYNRDSFRQWRRQAKCGLYVDRSYGLRDHPSSDYWKIMNNAFSGFDHEDEKKIERWLDSKS